MCDKNSRVCVSRVNRSASRVFFLLLLVEYGFTPLSRFPHPVPLHTSFFFADTVVCDSQ